jgi:hypothetical protein
VVITAPSAGIRASSQLSNCTNPAVENARMWRVRAPVGERSWARPLNERLNNARQSAPALSRRILKSGTDAASSAACGRFERLILGVRKLDRLAS